MAAATASPLNDNTYIEDIRSQMLKFTRLQLRGSDAMEQVQLNRARLSLQKCLDSHWFKDKSHA